MGIVGPPASNAVRAPTPVWQMREVVACNFFSRRLLRLRNHPGRFLSSSTSISINLICVIDRSRPHQLRVLQEVRVCNVFPFISSRATLT